MANVSKTSFEPIIRALSQEMEKTPVGESQEQVASRLDAVRLRFKLDHETFSLILAGIADYDPPGSPVAKQTAVRTDLDASIHQRTIQCLETELNTEPTGIAGLDRLRAVIAGTRYNDRPFGTVFYRNHLWGISHEPREYVTFCGFDSDGRNFTPSDGQSVAVAGSSVHHLAKREWRTRWPDVPYREGNYLVRSGKYFAYYGPEFADDQTAYCPKSAPGRVRSGSVVNVYLSPAEIRSQVGQSMDRTIETGVDSINKALYGPFGKELGRKPAEWILDESQLPLPSTDEPGEGESGEELDDWLKDSVEAENPPAPEAGSTPAGFPMTFEPLPGGDELAEVDLATDLLDEIGIGYVVEPDDDGRITLTVLTTAEQYDEFLTRLADRHPLP